jgi:hypothetical protein
VTSDAQSISVSRGRSRDLDSFSTGNARIRLLNNARK